VAAATSYLEVSRSLHCSVVDFVDQGNLWDDNLRILYAKTPRTRSMLIFNNAKLGHRTSSIRGSDRRSLVALQLIETGLSQNPRASEVPRLLVSPVKQDTLNALMSVISHQYSTILFPELMIWISAASGMHETRLINNRNKNRVERLHPGLVVHGQVAQGHYIVHGVLLLVTRGLLTMNWEMIGNNC